MSFDTYGSLTVLILNLGKSVSFVHFDTENIPFSNKY